MRTISLKDGVLPANPSWIDISETDADSRRWPTNTTSNPDAEGHVNFMDPLEVDHPASIKWRVTCGGSIAEILKMPDYQTKSYVLRSWPAGYQFYDHNKGSLSGIVRHDLYLIGSEFVPRFRSPHEFTPHAVWLLTDSTRDRANCDCKYCTRRPQKEITQGLPGTQQRSSTPSSQAGRLTGAKRLPRAVREAPLRIHALVRRAPKAAKLPKGPRQFSVPERERDLLAISTVAGASEKSHKRPRWARAGELVWIRLEHPIVVDEDTDPEQGITFWPGLVVAYELRVLASAKEPDNDVEMNGSQKSTTDECPWRLTHTTVYRVKPLVVNQEIRVQETRLLPYQAYGPSNTLLSAIHNAQIPIKSSKTVDDSFEAETRASERFASFNPFLHPGSDSESLTTADATIRDHIVSAAGAFALAIQVASRITYFWTPTDSWECKLTTNPADGPEQLVQMNSQTRFQGLWWGPERIWVGDLVRLKPGRFQFTPEGDNVIARPAKSKLPVYGVSSGQENGDVEMEDGSGTDSSTGAIFLRLDGLYAEREGNGKVTAMMSGMLFELVKEDWEEDETELYGSSAGQIATQTPTSPSRSQHDVPTPLRALMTPRPLVPPVHAPIFAPNPALLSTPLAIDGLVDEEMVDDEILLQGSKPPVDKGKGRALDPPALLAAAVPPRPLTFRPKPGPLPPPAATTGSLSGPSPPYIHRLPLPPIGCKFRPILPPTHEAVMSVLLLSGRYYSRILQNPLMAPFVERAMLDPLAKENEPLWALEGHLPGVHNVVDSSVWMPSRAGMVRTAAEKAKEEMMSYWRSRGELASNTIVLD